MITHLDIRTLIFHVFVPYANLSRVRGRLAHLQRVGEKPPSLLTDSVKIVYLRLYPKSVTTQMRPYILISEYRENVKNQKVKTVPTSSFSPIEGLFHIPHSV